MDGAGCNSDSSNDAPFGETLDAFLTAGNLAGGGSVVGGGTTPPNSGAAPLPLTETLGSGTGFLGGVATGTGGPGLGYAADAFFALNPQGVQHHGGVASTPNFSSVSSSNNNLLGFSRPSAHCGGSPPPESATTVPTASWSSPVTLCRKRYACLLAAFFGLDSSASFISTPAWSSFAWVSYEPPLPIEDRASLIAL